MTTTENSNHGKSALIMAVLTIVAVLSAWNYLVNAVDNIYAFIQAIEGLNSNGDIAIGISSAALPALPFVVLFGITGTCLLELYRYSKGYTSFPSMVGTILFAWGGGFGLMVYIGFVATMKLPSDALISAGMMTFPFMVVIATMLLMGLKVYCVTTRR